MVLLGSTRGMAIEHEENGKPDLYGVVMEGRIALASLSLPDGRKKWCAVGDRIGEYSVIEVNAVAKHVVVADGKGAQLILQLSKAPDKAGVVLTPLNALNWEWIRSEANPMRKIPKPLPEWVAKVWEHSDESFKLSFRNYYRSLGWDLTYVAVLPDGRIRQTISPLRNPSDHVLTPEEFRKIAVPATRPDGRTPR